MATEERTESLAEFMHNTRDLAVVREQQQTVLTVQKAAVEGEKERHHKERALIPTIRRKISSTFGKDISDRPASAEPYTVPPSYSTSDSYWKPIFQKNHNHRAENLYNSSERGAMSPRTLLKRDSHGADRPKHIPIIIPHESSHAKSELTSPTPLSKISVRKPHLTLDIAHAKSDAVDSSQNFPTSGSTPGILSDIVKNNDQGSVGKHAGDRSIQPSASGAFQAVNRPHQPSPLRTYTGSSASRSRKSKSRKFTDHHSEVKAIEAQILKDDFEINSSPQRPRKHRPRPSNVDGPSNRSNSPIGRSATTVYHASALPESSRNHTDSLLSIIHSPDFSTDQLRPYKGAFIDQGPIFPACPTRNAPDFLQCIVGPIDLQKREEFYNSLSRNGAAKQNATGLNLSFDSSISAANTYDSQSSTVANTMICASEDMDQSPTVSGSPETSFTSGSSSIRRKEVGSASFRGSLNAQGRSPTPSIGRGTDASFSGELGSSSHSSPVRVIGYVTLLFITLRLPSPMIAVLCLTIMDFPPDLGDTRSFTDPYTSPAASRPPMDSMGYIHVPGVGLCELCPVSSNVIRGGTSKSGGGTLTPMNCSSTSSVVSSTTNSFENHFGDSIPIALELRADNAIYQSREPDAAQTAFDQPSLDSLQKSWSRSETAAQESSYIPVVDTTHLRQGIMSRDFEPIRNVGAPSNRLMHEEKSIEDRKLQRLAKKNYPEYAYLHVATL